MSNDYILGIKCPYNKGLKHIYRYNKKAGNGGFVCIKCGKYGAKG